MSKLSQWKNKNTTVSIPKLGVNALKPASLGQERLYFLEKLHGNSLLYQYGHLYKFAEKIDLINLEDRFNAVIQRHDILRANFNENNGLIEINTTQEVNFTISHIDGNTEDFFQKPFNLKEDLLIRASLVDSHTLALSIHHIIADRQSLVILNEEVFSNKMETLSIQYPDFAAYYNTSVNQEKDLAYWKDILKGELPILSLPTDKKRPEHPNFSGKTILKTLDQTTSEGLKLLSKTTGSTLYTLLLSAYSIMLNKYSNQEDISIGTPISNRDKNEVQNLIGFFNETIVLRNHIKGTKSFVETVQQVKEGFINAVAHKNVSFDKVVSEIKPPRVKGVNPIFQHMFLFNSHKEEFSLNGQQVEEEIVDLGISKFDQTIFAIERSNCIDLKLEYSTELFTDVQSEQFLNHFSKLLQIVVRDPNLKIHDIELEDDQQINQSPDQFKQDPKFSSILDLMDFTSSDIAVECKGEKLTYHELGIRSTLVAAQLISAGLQPSDFVGLYTNRSIEMVIGIIGILKAGGAYIPLDPNYPAERLDHMIADSGVKIIVHNLPFHQDEVISIDLDNLKESSLVGLPKISKKDLAYMIYTSGSTGKPKGVPITHGNIICSTEARFKFYPEQPRSFLLLSSFSFDSSVAGIFWTLCSKGTLVLPPERIEQDIDGLCETIAANSVTHTLMLPSLYQVLLQYSAIDKLASLKNVIVAGEACSSSVVDLHYNKLPLTILYNEYGPTEGTVWCIAHEIKKDDSEPIPIGKPIPFYTAYVLNNDGTKSPKGVTGELYIGGPGLSPGYWNQERLSEVKFINHRLHGRIYQTGDLVKLNTKNELLFLGRKDNQVKIRGHRVELNEIRNRILAFEEINEAEIVFQDGQLTAYVDGKMSGNLEMPDYMIPSSFITLDHFPKLPNGKVDRSKLSKPTESKNQREVQAANSDLEKRLLSIWKEVLDQEVLGIDDNFFEIGGDSLLSIQIVSKARDLEIKLRPTQLFDHQTIKSLAKSIEAPISDSKSEILVAFNSSGNRTPLFCIHGGGAHVFFYKKFASYFPSDLPIYSFQPKGLDGQTEMAADIKEMATLYIQEMKEVQPEGPYQILGTCFSNAVAIEMANQLHEAGEKLNHLFIIDSAPVHLFGNEEGKERQTIKRFIDMALRGDFSRIKAKIISRISKDKKWDSTIKQAIETDEVLDQTIKNLNKMYADYSWKPYQGKIDFIRSSEFHHRKDKSYHLTQWNKLAEGGLNVSVVDGHHLTLFEEPEVKGLASEIESLISESIPEYA